MLLNLVQKLHKKAIRQLLYVTEDNYGKYGKIDAKQNKCSKVEKQIIKLMLNDLLLHQCHSK